MKKMKKALAVLLAVLTAVTLGTAGSAASPEVVASGELGHDNLADLTWRLTSDGALTIEGTGAINHEKIQDIWPYVDLVRNVTVGEGVTNLLSFLDGCMALETVTLPASLKYDITYFTNTPRQFFVDPASPYFAVGPDGCLYNKDLTTFYKYAGGSERTEYTLPEHTIHVRHGAFLGAEYLTKIVLHDNVAELPYNMCRACTALEEVTLPSHAAIYAGHLFYECTALKNFVIPDWMTVIPIGMFHSCTALESVTIPETVTNVENGAFYQCTSLREIRLPDTMELLGSDTVGYCTALTEFTVPASVVTIQQYACIGCANLETVRIPAGVTEIGKNAFKDCGKIKDVYIEMSPAQWAQVEIAEGNEDLLNAQLHFNYPHEHSFSYVLALPPTCTEAGREDNTCSLCGLVDGSRPVAPNGHIWNEGTLLQEATEHAPGKVLYDCLACRETYTADAAPAGWHDWKPIPVRPDGLNTGECWLDTAGVLPADGAWYADYNTCVLKREAGGETAYYGSDVFTVHVREAGAYWLPVAYGSEGLQDGAWYMDPEDLINAIGVGKTQEEKQEALQLLLNHVRFYINPQGNLYRIRFDYTDLPGADGTESGTVVFPLSLQAGDENAFVNDYNALNRCIKQYHAEQPAPKPGGLQGIVASLKAVIRAVLSFFRRLFRSGK